MTWIAACIAQEPGVTEPGVTEPGLTELGSSEKRTLGIEFFETQVRPVLAQHCYECHGPDKQKGNLRLDNLPSILQGGESGPAILVGDPENSLLIQAVRYESLQMPPTGKIATSKIDALKRWIAASAPVAQDFASIAVPKVSLKGIDRIGLFNQSQIQLCLHIHRGLTSTLSMHGSSIDSNEKGSLPPDEHRRENSFGA